MKGYLDKCHKLLEEFSIVHIKFVHRAQNEEADRLAQGTSCSYEDEIIADDRRNEIIDYLTDPSQKTSRRIQYKSIKYVLLDEKLYYRTIDGVLSKCVNQEE